VFHAPDHAKSIPLTCASASHPASILMWNSVRSIDEKQGRIWGALRALFRVECPMFSDRMPLIPPFQRCATHRYDTMTLPISMDVIVMALASEKL
jgi:hypothetical protein